MQIHTLEYLQNTLITHPDQVAVADPQVQLTFEQLARALENEEIVAVGVDLHQAAGGRQLAVGDQAVHGGDMERDALARIGRGGGEDVGGVR